MNMTTDERKRSYSNKSNGWLATLAGAAVLVAVGFGVGLVAGTAYEEPELVAQHLAGQTTDVALGPVGGGLAEGGRLDGDVAAAPPADAPLAEPEAVLEAPPTPLGAGALDETREEALAAKPAAAPLAAQKPVVKPAAGGAGFSIQVGAFANESTAKQLAGELGKRGYQTYVTSEGAGARFKVRVGPIASRSEAEQISERLKTEHRLPTWILASGK
jgi:cell division septation protein DedD